MSKSIYISTSGNDNNSGLSSEIPIKTINKINSLSLLAGDKVLFKCGDIWQGVNSSLILASGNSNGYVAYSYYGSGNRPILTTTSIKNNLTDWIDDSGNIWSTSSSVDVGLIISSNNNIIGKKVWNLTDITEQGKYWYDIDNKKLRIYSVGNPATYYNKDIQLVLRNHGITGWSKNYIAIDGLHISKVGEHGISFQDVGNIVVQNCLFDYIGGADEYLDKTSKMRFGNGLEFWNSAHDTVVQNCVFNQIYDGAFTTQGNLKSVMQHQSFNNNVCNNCERPTEFWCTPDSVFSDIKVENNQLLNSGYGWGHERLDTGNARALAITSMSSTAFGFSFQHNIITNSKDSIYRISDYNWISSMVLDYNIYSNSDGMFMHINNGDDYTMDKFYLWKSNFAKDVHSIVI